MARAVIAGQFLPHAHCCGDDFRAATVSQENADLHLDPSGEQPGLCAPPTFLKGSGQPGVVQGQPDVVPAIAQAFAAERIDGKRQCLTIGPQHLLW
jgi:hypothetical protein